MSRPQLLWVLGSHAPRAVQAVPMFQFYRNMELIDSFATRDRVRLAKAINKHTGADTVHVMKEDE